MFCSNCGKENSNEAKFCSSCGTRLGDEIQKDTSPKTRDVPKCTCCGHIGKWKVGPIFRPMDYVVGIGLLIFGVVPGIIYMAVVGLIRYDEKNREKICQKCNARNMFTHMY